MRYRGSGVFDRGTAGSIYDYMSLRISRNLGKNQPTERRGHLGLRSCTSPLVGASSTVSTYLTDKAKLYGTYLTYHHTYYLQLYSKFTKLLKGLLCSLLCEL